MPALVCFGPFELDLSTADLRRNGRKMRLPEQQFQILEMLLRDQGNLVSREEIRKRLWPNDTMVEFDRSINAAIKKLRAALEDSADAPRFVETVARRGYRILVEVQFPSCSCSMVYVPMTGLLPKNALVTFFVCEDRRTGVEGRSSLGQVDAKQAIALISTGKEPAWKNQ
jgi:DNA-binding winged helix-turn-helix (wHTH) protein